MTRMNYDIIHMILNLEYDFAALTKWGARSWRLQYEIFELCIRSAIERMEK